MNTDKLSGKYGTSRSWLRELISEFIGTLLAVFIGNCSMAQLILSATNETTPITFHFAVGIAYTLGMLVTMSASGGHMNPAVTLASVLIGKLKWTKMLHYFIAQYIGGFCAAALTYLLYSDCIYDFDEGIRKTRGLGATAEIFATIPEDHVSQGLILLNQILGGFILMLAICAVTDEYNFDIDKSLHPLYIGLAIVVIDSSLGHITKFPINPARDFLPRLFLVMAGWGEKPYSYRPIWWIPLAGPHAGAVLGAIVYLLLIKVHLKRGTDRTDPSLATSTGGSRYT